MDIYCQRAEAKYKINDLHSAISDYSNGIDLYEKMIKKLSLDLEGGYEHILLEGQYSRRLKIAYRDRGYIYSVMKNFSMAENDFNKLMSLEGRDSEYKLINPKREEDKIKPNDKLDPKQESLNELDKRGIKFSQVDFIEEVISKGDENLTKLFILAGINVNHPGAFGNTPLHWAAIKGYYSLIDILLNAGANLEAKCTNYSFTPLIVAIQNNQYLAVEKLMQRGANIFAKDKDGNTPLHSASIIGNENIVSKLISLGANVNAKDNQGVTPKFLANYCKHQNIVNILKRAGAN